ncbi:hypothetical protein CAOG_08304 [Capsaspora owczarzaki ATCC 30864]|uniref:Small integral membrane protein 8 n=1 Tax=Capsaspora owczarzaki (strain ATCC 30864) TaxID=595528 RepID=A0A0D2WY60_CAPO3|nr:hypothetical protein CAOG_08304 [Capsaspora owczarzaki ATCC 30864]KJE98325.1 hypothetical protein CAOG_008304 [Capsaspora owczarzaki ATCC 30864]|eukprot:XP_004341904.1 hypothetical protein CAOG_08304 [Capsaspora owczarzaki ATCC 30864]
MSDKEPPKRPPVTSTTLFRVLNPELFLRPNKYVMAFGLGALTLSLGFVWWQSEGQLGPNSRC